MPKIYPKLADMINKTTFECRQYGDFVRPNMSAYFKMYPDRKPPFTNEQKSSPTWLTVHQMILRYDQKDTFTICRPEDVVTITYYLGEYLNQVGPFIDAITDLADPTKRKIEKARLFHAYLLTVVDRAQFAVLQSKGLQDKFDETAAIGDLLND